MRHSVAVILDIFHDLGFGGGKILEGRADHRLLLGRGRGLDGAAFFSASARSGMNSPPQSRCGPPPTAGPLQPPGAGAGRRPARHGRSLARWPGRRRRLPSRDIGGGAARSGLRSGCRAALPAGAAAAGGRRLSQPDRRGCRPRRARRPRWRRQVQRGHRQRSGQACECSLIDGLSRPGFGLSATFKPVNPARRRQIAIQAIIEA